MRTIKVIFIIIALSVFAINALYAQGTTCDTINMPVTPGWSGITYDAPDPFGGKTGYINGTNGYKDLHKANYFDLTGQSFTYILGTIVKFGKANTATGTNLSKPIFFKVYAADGTGGKPGTLLGTAEKTLEQVKADVAAGIVTQVNFPAAVSIPANKKFYISVDIANFKWPFSGGAKDSIWIAGTEDDQVKPNAAWDYQADSSWVKFSDNWSNPTDGSNELDVTLWIFPYVSNVAAGCTLLPVKLLTFNANRISNDVTVKWEVSEEFNMNGYEVEKANNDGSYSPIEYVPAVNSFKKQAYAVTDRNAFSTSQTVQYRLKQIDGDGTITFSRIIAVKSASDIADVLFANPFSGALKLQLNLATAQSVGIKIFDMQGRLTVMEKPVLYSAAANTIIIPSSANLKPGTYVMQITAGKEQLVYKIVKQ